MFGAPMKGVRDRATTTSLETFGQTVPPGKHLSKMALDIASGIGDGKPAAFAGFVWYRPAELSPESIRQRIENLLRTADAA